MRLHEACKSPQYYYPSASLDPTQGTEKGRGRGGEKGANSLGDPAQRTRIRGEGADALEVGRLQDVALVERVDLVGAAAGVVGTGADGYLVLGQFRGFSFG